MSGTSRPAGAGPLTRFSRKGLMVASRSKNRSRVTSSVMASSRKERAERLYHTSPGPADVWEIRVGLPQTSRHRRFFCAGKHPRRPWAVRSSTAICLSACSNCNSAWASSTTTVTATGGSVEPRTTNSLRPVRDVRTPPTAAPGRPANSPNVQSRSRTVRKLIRAPTAGRATWTRRRGSTRCRWRP